MDSTPPLPLFPLQAVLFPGGLLKLKVFEARYLHLISTCLRERQAFGVVCLQRGAEVHRAGQTPVRFESVGVLAGLLKVDADQPGLLHVECLGGQRFETGPLTQDEDGLWHTHQRSLPDDITVRPTADLVGTATALSKAIASLRAQGQQPFIEPYRLNDAAWVANRWCEILPISLPAKQSLMVLDDPLLRLRLVRDYLHSKGVEV